MKVFAYLMVLSTIFLSSCSSQKKFASDAPFEMGEVTCQAWVGGMAESGSGMLLEIPVLSENLDAMKLQQAYFRGKVADIRLENTAAGWMAKANFKNVTMEKPDITMHSDATKEVGNQPPMPMEKFPFELDDNECVISFLDGDKMKYFKIGNITEKKSKVFN